MKFKRAKAATTPNNLWKTYSRRIFDYCNINNVKTVLVNKTKSSVSFKATGKDALNLFRDEAGKHVVQRCPPTESKGRRHTSTVAVSVLILREEREFSLRDQDLEVTTQRGHGPGGQHQNTTDSAVRMIHKPTGIEVFINGRDQHANRREARGVMESRVAKHYETIESNKRSRNKRQQVDGGGRSNKIRTYNFISSRATDHRTGIKTSNIKKVMKGRFDLLK